MKVLGAVAADVLSAMDAFARDHGISEQVFRAIDRNDLDYDILQMDEYSLDVVVAWPGGAWLVYDTT